MGSETVACALCGKPIAGLTRTMLSVDLSMGTEHGKKYVREHIARCLPSLEKLRRPAKSRWN